MSGMTHAAVAGDIAEAEEIQELLRNAGIESSLQPLPDEDAVNILVAEGDLEDAKDAIEALTEPDDLSSDL